jgi:hypothetical protein
MMESATNPWAAYAQQWADAAASNSTNGSSTSSTAASS